MKKILDLLEYNLWANDQFIIRLKEQEGLPPRIPELLSHILLAHQVWLNRIHGKKEVPQIWGDVDTDRWEEINIELFHESGDIIKSRDPGQIIHYANSKGQLFETPLDDILYHVINHGTHHRAQISVLMRQNQILPPASDYIYYLRR